MDRNGYNDSLFDTEAGRCWLCGAVTDTARHELFRGTNRSNSKREGLWVNVCPRCHDLCHRHDYEDELHRVGQVQFLHNGKTKEEFVRIFGKNYL